MEALNAEVKRIHLIIRGRLAMFLFNSIFSVTTIRAERSYMVGSAIELVRLSI